MIPPHTLAASRDAIPRHTVPWSTDLNMGEIMVGNALAVVGVEAGDPRTRPVLDELCGPPVGGWGLDYPYGAGGVSTCAMVALGLLRWLGVDCPAIQDGYDVGTGLRVAIDWARGLVPRSAWITPEPGLRPNPGDVVQLVDGGGGVHVLTVIGYDGESIVSVDGGQVGRGGLQAVHRVTRRWREDRRGAKVGRRRIDGWLAIDLLPYSGDVTILDA